MASDPVRLAADALRSQVANLGKQLSDYRLSQEEGVPGSHVSRNVGSIGAHATYGGRTSYMSAAPSQIPASQPSYSPSHLRSAAGVSALRSGAAGHTSLYTPGGLRSPGAAASASLHNASTFTRPSSAGPNYSSAALHRPYLPAHTPYASEHAPRPASPAYHQPMSHISSYPAVHSSTGVQHRTSAHYSIPSSYASPIRRSLNEPALYAAPPPPAFNNGGLPQGETVAGREEARLRELLQELRHDRRRLEDKLMSGDSQSVRVQDVRDELERQVGTLSKQRDLLEAEVGSLKVARETASAVDQEVMMLRDALGAEQQATAQLTQLRNEMEVKIGELVSNIDALTAQHTQAVNDLSQERDGLVTQLGQVTARLSSAEQQADQAKAELDLVRRECHGHQVSLAEVRASAEVLQHASSQMQSQLLSSKQSLEERVSSLSVQLEAARHEAAQAGAAASSNQQALQDSNAQLKESLCRTDFLRAEREKLVKVLAAEQAAAGDLRRQLEAAQAKVASAEARAAAVELSARQQVEAVQREHETRVAALTRQFETQLSAAEKTAAAAARQHDSSLGNTERLVEIQQGLRRERDELWAELESVKQEAAGLRAERDSLAGKVSHLRAEVKAAMDDVRGDRDARLASAMQQHDVQMSRLKAHYEAEITSAAAEHHAQAAGLREVTDRLKAELSDAQRTADKYKSTVSHLKEQLAAALVLRDDLEREVTHEKQYSEELGRIVTQIKAAGLHGL